MNDLLNKLFILFLSRVAKEKFEHFILRVAIFSFIIHLGLIYINSLGFLDLAQQSELLVHPISAIYTPFSFILVYEVYLLIYYLPKSITTYLVKQYEIVLLIIIRRLFKDLSHIEFTTDWFANSDDLILTYDLLTSIFIFGLLYLFNVLIFSRKKDRTLLGEDIKTFIRLKRHVAIILFFVFIILALYSFSTWAIYNVYSLPKLMKSMKGVNSIFFDEFFTILIIVDVFLLLISFNHSDHFYTVIRNSGFIISTILIRLSFSTSGLLSNLLVLSAVLFGVIILWLHNKHEQLYAQQQLD